MEHTLAPTVVAMLTLAKETKCHHAQIVATMNLQKYKLKAPTSVGAFY